MMSIRLSILAIVASVLCRAQSGLTLDDAIHQALASRASLKAESERVSIAEQMRIQAGKIPNPEFQFQNENLRSGQTYSRDVGGVRDACKCKAFSLRNGESKCRAHPDLGTGPDLSTMAFDYTFADRQADSCALVLAPMQPLEGRKDSLRIRLRETEPLSRTENVHSFIPSSAET